MQKNDDDAYLLYFMKMTVSLISLSVKRHLQFHSFFPIVLQNPLCHCLDVHYTMFSQLTFFI